MSLTITNKEAYFIRSVLGCLYHVFLEDKDFDPKQDWEEIQLMQDIKKIFLIINNERMTKE